MEASVRPDLLRVSEELRALKGQQAAPYLMKDAPMYSAILGGALKDFFDLKFGFLSQMYILLHTWTP